MRILAVFWEVAYLAQHTQNNNRLFRLSNVIDYCLLAPKKQEKKGIFDNWFRTVTVCSSSFYLVFHLLSTNSFPKVDECTELVFCLSSQPVNTPLALASTFCAFTDTCKIRQLFSVNWKILLQKIHGSA